MRATVGLVNLKKKMPEQKHFLWIMRCHRLMWVTYITSHCYYDYILLLLVWRANINYSLVIIHIMLNHCPGTTRPCSPALRLQLFISFWQHVFALISSSYLPHQQKEGSFFSPREVQASKQTWGGTNNEGTGPLMRKYVRYAPRHWGNYSGYMCKCNPNSYIYWSREIQKKKKKETVKNVAFLFKIPLFW